MYAPPPLEAENLPYNASYQGGAGPICPTFQQSVWSFLSDYARPTLVNQGNNSNDSNANGSNFLPLAIYPQNYTRSFAGSACTVVQSRSTLLLLQDAHVSRIIWSSTEADNATASGLEYIDLTSSSTKSTRTIFAREVILSAGIVYSPQILQLGDIGDVTTLSAAGVQKVINFTKMGTSLRDPIRQNYWYIYFPLHFTAVTAAANLSGNKYTQNLIDLESASKMLSLSDYALISAWLNRITHIPGLADAQFAVLNTSDSPSNR